MNCPNCNSNNITVQVLNEQKLVNKRKGVIWWLLIGWWWIFIKWICFTFPALLFAIFVGKEKKIENVQRKLCVCQNCGNSWYIK